MQTETQPLPIFQVPREKTFNPESTNIALLAHVPSTTGTAGVLVVAFHNGSAYAYEGVTQETYALLASAESVGKHFNANIRGAKDKNDKPLYRGMKVDLRLT